MQKKRSPRHARLRTWRGLDDFDDADRPLFLAIMYHQPKRFLHTSLCTTNVVQAHKGRKEWKQGKARRLLMRFFGSCSQSFTTILPYRSALHLIFNRLLSQCSPTDMQM